MTNSQRFWQAVKVVMISAAVLGTGVLGGVLMLERNKFAEQHNAQSETINVLSGRLLELEGINKRHTSMVEYGKTHFGWSDADVVKMEKWLSK